MAYELHMTAVAGSDDVVVEIYDNLGNGSKQKVHAFNGGSPVNTTIAALYDKGFTAIASSVNIKDPYVREALDQFILLNG